MQDVQVVVIGAGAVGAACAAAVSQVGGSVTVLRHSGRSTTAVSGGHLLLHSKRPGAGLGLARRSQELVATLARGREQFLGYRRTGSLLVARNTGAVEALDAHHQVLKRAEVPVEWLTSKAAQKIEPGLAGDVVAASYCPLDAQVRPERLAATWLEQAGERGARVVDAPVEAIRPDDATDGGWTVRTRTEEFRAKVLVLAAGPWSTAIGHMIGLDLEVRPRRGVLLRSRTDRKIASRPLLGAEYLEAKFGETVGGVAFSFQQHPDGECVLGGSREFVGWDEGEVEPLRERILELGKAYLPDLHRLSWRGTTVGYRPWTPTGEPYLGPCEVPGVLLACGFEGDGITQAAGAAERIAASVAEVLES